MLPRERVNAAIAFKSPDMIPLRIFPAAGGLYEHGQKLVDLTKACGHDFGDLSGLALPVPPGPEDFDKDGRYHAIRTDDWGTTWEYRIFGIWGHPIEWPLNDLSKLDTYRPPSPPSCHGPEFGPAKAAIDVQKQTYFTLGWGGSILEKLCSIRRFEDVLMDIASDTRDINRIADMITENALGHVNYSLALGVDGVCFGDDFGTQTAPLVSPAVWERFFKPRYEALFEPIRRSGRWIFFHSCGEISFALEHFKSMGVDVIWPQLTAFELPELARRCHDLKLTVELHPDRGDLMQRATPDQVRNYVHRLIDVFGTGAGGSWLYIEVDPGFPYANVETLLNTAMELRNGKLR